MRVKEEWFLSGLGHYRATFEGLQGRRNNTNAKAKLASACVRVGGCVSARGERLRSGDRTASSCWCVRKPVGSFSFQALFSPFSLLKPPGRASFASSFLHTSNAVFPGDPYAHARSVVCQGTRAPLHYSKHAPSSAAVCRSEPHDFPLGKTAHPPCF